MYKKILFLFLAVAMTGCQTTGDPTKGGLFGWSEKKADKRQEDMKQNLKAEEREGQIGVEERDRLEIGKSEKEAELEQERVRLSELEANINVIEEKIRRKKADTTASQQEKQRIKGKVGKYKKQIKAIRKDTQSSAHKKKKKIDALNGEIDKLFEIVDSL